MRHNSTRRSMVVRALVVVGILASSLALAPTALAAVTLGCSSPVNVGSSTNCSANATGGAPLTYQFTFEGVPRVPQSGSSASSDAFNTTGPKAVSVEVTYSPVTTTDPITGVETTTTPPAEQATATVTVYLRPTAEFTFLPKPFGPGQQVTLTSKSPEPGANPTIIRHDWDLNGDGSWDRNTGRTPRVTATFFAATRVRLRVRDSSTPVGESVFETMVVPNDTPPTPSFSFQPVPPGAGQQVTFTSTSADVEGAIANHAWDLDGDGTFETDTGSTPSVSRSFPRAGSYRVSLRVSDASGQRAISTQAVTVNATATVAAAAASAAVSARLPLLRPFPVVRLRGTLTRSGARIRLLSVQAPTGARVTVRCKGRSCGKRHSQALRSRSTRSLRFTRYHRHLRAGTVLQVFVAKAGTIGKYVRFTIRKNKPPLRRDSCVAATSWAPSRCPSG